MLRTNSQHRRCKEKGILMHRANSQSDEDQPAPMPHDSHAYRPCVRCAPKRALEDCCKASEGWRRNKKSYTQTQLCTFVARFMKECTNEHGLLHLLAQLFQRVQTNWPSCDSMGILNRNIPDDINTMSFTTLLTAQIAEW